MVMQRPFDELKCNDPDVPFDLCVVQMGWSVAAMDYTRLTGFVMSVGCESLVKEFWYDWFRLSAELLDQKHVLRNELNQKYVRLQFQEGKSPLSLPAVLIKLVSMSVSMKVNKSKTAAQKDKDKKNVLKKKKKPQNTTLALRANTSALNQPIFCK